MAVEISVVIPCYRHARELVDCLRALDAQQTDVEFEVIVVESAVDEAGEEAVRGFPGVRVFRSRHRLFAGAARNFGARRAAGTGLAFVDADCIPSPTWIAQAQACLRSGHKITGGPIRDPEPVSAMAWVDNRLQFSDQQKHRPAGTVDHVPSCNLVISRGDFEALGGFNETVVTGEDVLLSLRAATTFDQALFFDPRLVVYHRGRGNWREFLEHQFLLGRYRGELGLMITPAWATISRSPWLAGLAVARRFAYVGLRVMQYDRESVGRFVAYSPLILCGLVEWVRGFYLGVEVKARSKEEFK